jgi:hypothetical protein
MKSFVTKFLVLALLLVSHIFKVKAEDSISIYVTLNYYWDLSDTYGGGNLFDGEISALKSWYGAKLAYGHFQSDYIFLFKVPYDEANLELRIPVHEMSFMKTGSLSGFIRPIQNKWFSTDFVVGAVYSRSSSFYLKAIEYSYNIEKGSFDYLIRDYQLIKKNCVGYQVGIDLTFNIIKSIAIRLSSRIQDFRKEGSFFFMGSGICFKF